MREKNVLCTNHPAHQRAPVSAKTTILLLNRNGEISVFSKFEANLLESWKTDFP